MKVFLFNNGNSAFFDEKGEQVPELQRSWFLLYVVFLKEKGIDPTEVDFMLPCGRAKIFEIPEEHGGGYNWRIL